jgi:succinate dehydrogenase flavin-adding protein (antitoxin of CptAB toxin-antitoxin module)
MKELDVLLERYLNRDLDSASIAECEAFVGLLDLQDPELARYLLAGEPHPDPAVTAVVSRMRSA